ncbi:short-chain dehydrogenase [Longibacter salinarum]|uniref:Short-chain dehydrogenase n=1 Tax=Longibacter salinarum TaxID=1850348 RepID=A0A2A8CWF4_9BACT|nr:glucose 1-dehydrogenase [Longibacter salinarum]PEN12927.1 short-chain dehydrogenase [Longibacter salinarum]
MGRAEDRVVIVTGAALGIGKATAEVFADEGARVALTDVLDDEGKEAARRIRDAGGEAQFWPMDVSVEEEVRDTFAEIHDHYERVDVLVNNAGISGVNLPTHEIEADDWKRVMDVNVMGVFYCTKHAIPYMKEAGAGSIINISSIYGLVGGPDVPPYHASKGAVRLMTKTDALLYAEDKIRVNSIHPGYIWTPMVENHLKKMGDVEEGKQQTAAMHPLGHMGKPEDIAYGVLYLASDEAKFVTGSELVIDGGYTAR